MLSIAQINDSFHYLHWIPSEHGPLINGYGSLNFPNISLSEPEALPKIFRSILNEVKIEIPVFTFSLDIKELQFSTTVSHPDINIKEFLTWQYSHNFNDQFLKSYQSYSYHLKSENQTLLNLHIPIKIKNSFDNTMKDLGGELRNVSMGIFSAEIGARQWMKANDIGSYIIWRLGKYKTDQLIAVEQNEMIYYSQIKRTGTQIKKVMVCGQENKLDEFILDLEQYNQNKLKSFKSTAMVYCYKGKGSKSELKKLCESDISNIKLLNPLSVVKCEDNHPGNLYASAQLAETGASFRGIDV